jgi:type I restriction enzyme, R subunit
MLDRLFEHGWEPVEGKVLAPGSGQRKSWSDLVLRGDFDDALRRLNPGVPPDYLAQAAERILTTTSQDALTENQRIHDIYIDGHRGITYLDDEGIQHTPTIRVLGPDPADNIWYAAHQVTIRQGEYERRFDVVLYCNGLPVAVAELKKAGDDRADVAAAHAQLGTYLSEFPLAFRFCLCVVVSDGRTARYGTPFTPLHHFSPWNVDDDGAHIPEGTTDPDGHVLSGLDLLIDGVFNQERFLQLLRNFTAFDHDDIKGLAKRIAKPHQYFAVTKAVATTVQAVESNGRAGVVWHTQGSGKSMEMELYTGLVMRHPKLVNPTVVVVTDRTELDGQLYGSFAVSQLLPETPKIITSRAELRDELSNRTSGGIYFTTLQKFTRTGAERAAGADHPTLCDRHNVIVIVDEAHRSHYDDLDGYARHLKSALPRATMIAFTGTPISSADRDTREVFGDYIDIYDLSRAVADGATVPVAFEPRLIKITLADGVTQDDLDTAADEATTGLDDIQREKIEQSVAVVNAVYGAPARVAELARDIVEHWEARRKVVRPFIEVDGKALIVCATRQICADLYDRIVALRPDWHSDDVTGGVVKVVYSGSACDPDSVRRHVRRDSQNAAIKKRLKDPDDPLQLVIVKDMMLTGFDAPPLHTLYLDRPLKNALLMQTLARVNRTFRGKQDGLMVAYAPLAENLRNALAEYSPTDHRTEPVGRNVSQAVTLLRELLGTIRPMLATVDWRAMIARDRRRGYLTAVYQATNHLRDPRTPGNRPGDRVKNANTGRDDLGGLCLADKFRRTAAQLARTWALCSTSPDVGDDLRREVAFYEEVRVWMAKFDAEERAASGLPVPEDVARLLHGIIAEATASHEVLDVYEAAGMPRPTLDDLTPEFVAAAQAAHNPHLAIEALRRLINEESLKVTRNNVVRRRAFSDRVAELMTRYTNQQLTSAEVIAELIAVARDVAAEARRGGTFDPPLQTDELAFYDVVSLNESAVDVLGSGILADIARDLVAVMQRDTRTDWTVRDDVRAKLRSVIKRLLVKHGYPPDKQPEAIKLVIETMESMAPRYSQERIARRT